MDNCQAKWKRRGGWLWGDSHRRCFCHCGVRSPGATAFTLIELMVVVAIMGVVMTMALPAIYRQLNPGSMQKVVNDLLEACSHARARAILSGQPVELRIQPLDKIITLGGSADAGPLSKSVSGDAWREKDTHGDSSGGRVQVKIPDRIQIAMLDINFWDFTQEETAAVRFYPNGTSDEFTIVLMSDDNEWRKISLEVVTALADVETDPKKFLQ